MECLVRAGGVVVVAEVLSEHGSKVPFAEDDHVIETLSSDRANHALGDGIRLGARNGVTIGAMPRRRNRKLKSPP